MKGLISEVENKLVYAYDDETIWIESYGENSLRVRISKLPIMPENNLVLIKQKECKVNIQIGDTEARITNGKISAIINEFGFITFVNQRGEILLKERWQDRQDSNNHMSVMYYGRELKPILGGQYKATITFEANDKEKVFGMGQRQLPYLDLKGCDLELAQRNSQASIPFILSNLGYGFFWNNPAHGKATFAKNYTQWTSEVTSSVDYWITAGDTPDEINQRYTDVVGKASKFPEWAAGFWQCKLRYKTQDELLEVAREYKRRGLPISVIVIDFFHWPQQGDWKFDERYWPDPKAMVDELKSMGIELMVSIWPTVDPRSENYAEMKKMGYLVRTDRGVRTQQVCLGAEVYFDATNPGARKFIFEKAKENYMKYGVRMFWLDEAEPEYTHYDFDIYRYYLGPNQEVGNIYPMYYSKAFYDGMIENGIDDPINLVRCAWAGSQRYGAVLWSGDIHSNFKTLRMQLAAGLNVGLSGIPWWTTDIGGFFGGDPNDEYFRELIVRWFQFGVFCPIFRLHGYRLPTGEGTEGEDTGLFDFDTCGKNEVWEFGEEAYKIISNLMFMRERLKPYILKAMNKASELGTPPMRPIFYDFYNDEIAWKIEDQFMFGDVLMIAPVLYGGMDSREVYLPKGAKWRENLTGKVYDGGQTIICDAPIDVVPIFIKNNEEIGL